MKRATSIFTSILAMALGSCTSDKDPLLDQNETGEGQGLPAGQLERVEETGPWTVSEEDNRTQLNPCYLQVLQGNITSSELTFAWTEPANAPRAPLYRLEVAEEATFTEGYRSLANLSTISMKIDGLKPNQPYYARLQAYLVADDATDANASATGTQVDFAPSEAEVVTTDTKRNSLALPGNLEIIVENGAFSARWDSPDNATGKLEYVVTLYSDESLQTGLGQQLLKQPKIDKWVVEPEFDYWLSVRALPDPDSTNKIDGDSQALVKQFRVPGNRLDTPKNFRVVLREDLIDLTWEPIENQSGNFEYLLQVFLDEERTETFGKYQLEVTREQIPNIKLNRRYWIDLQAVPASGNFSDAPSDTTSSIVELPELTYATPVLGEFKIVPVEDPEEPSSLVILQWDQVANADGKQKYRIEISEDQNFEEGVQDYVEDGNSIKGEFGPFDPGKTFFVRMKAVSPEEDVTRVGSGWSQTKSFATDPVATPVVPEQ